MLGLIQVMKDLADIEKVGHGIATAFVATIYGVAFANLFFLPAAGKIKARAQQQGADAGTDPRRSGRHRGGLEPEADPQQARSLLAAGEPPKPKAKIAREARRIMSAHRKKTPDTRKSRAVAHLLCGLHHPAVCVFRGDVRLVADRQAQGAADVRFDPKSLGEGPDHDGNRRNSRWSAGAERIKGNAQMKGAGGQERAFSAARRSRQTGVTCIPSLTILQKQLKREIDTGMLQVNMEPRGLVVSLRQAAFFPPGQDTIDASTYPTIQKLAEVIMAVPNKVRLEGHTDAVPIHNARYRSNWELSAARGVTMLELLTNRYNVPESRLSVGGYAETIAIASNDTAEGRARNRRVDIVILNENGAKGEPIAAK